MQVQFKDIYNHDSMFVKALVFGMKLGCLKLAFSVDLELK